MRAITLFITFGLLGFSNVVCSQPSKLSATDTITIVTFNDFHGNLVANPADGVPGAARFFEQIKDLKTTQPNAIVVSAGDNFWGTYFTTLTRGVPLDGVYKKLIDVSALGNHDLDWGVPFIRDTLSRWVEFVAANVVDKTTNAIPAWLKPYKIIECRLKRGRKFKIAFVGVATAETLNKTSGDVSMLKFDTTLVEVRKTVRDLKKGRQADMVVLLTHLGSKMSEQGLLLESYAKALPFVEGVDAIITGHSHDSVFGMVNNIPVIQSKSNGAYIGKLLFGVSDEGEPRFLGGGNSKVACDGSRNERIDRSVARIMAERELGSIVTHAKETLKHTRDSLDMRYFSEVGAYITDSYVRFYREVMKPASTELVIGLNHFKGIRAGLPSGEVRLLDVGNVLPFGENTLTAYALSGRELKAILQVGTTRSEGWIQSSNLAIAFAGDGTIERIASVRGDGSEVEIGERTPCIVVLDSTITGIREGVVQTDGYPRSLFDDSKVIDSFKAGKYSPTRIFVDYLSGKEYLSKQTAPVVRVTRL